MTLAPQSSTTVWPRMVGQIEAMAGREMPSMMPSWNMRHRHQRAGIAGARPRLRPRLFFTHSMARHMRGVRGRGAAHGWACLPSPRGRAHGARVTRSFSLGWRASSAFSTVSSPSRRKRTSGWRCADAQQRGHDNAGAGIAAHRINRDGQFAGHGHPSLRRRGRLALRLHDFAVGIMAAGAADMMRTLGLAAFGAVGMGRRPSGRDATGACCGATARFFVLGPPWREIS